MLLAGLDVSLRTAFTVNTVIMLFLDGTASHYFSSWQQTVYFKNMPNCPNSGAHRNLQILSVTCCFETYQVEMPRDLKVIDLRLDLSCRSLTRDLNCLLLNEFEVELG